MGAGGSKKVKTPEDFNPEILNSLSTEVKDQLEKYAENQENCIEELKERYDKLKVDSEQRNFEIEKQLVSTSEKLESETKNASEVRSQLAELEKKYNDAASQARELQASQFENEKRYNAVEQINRQLSSEKQELSNAVDKKTHEIEQLTADWKQMSQRVAEANKSKIEALTKSDELQSQNITVQHKEERLRQERDTLQQQNDWLQSGIREKTQQLLSARRDQAGRILELQAQHDEKTEELSHLQQLVESLKQTNEEQNVKIENYIQKLKDARDNEVIIEEQFKAELQSQSKLAEIYKKAADMKTGQVGELMPAVEELQGLLKEAATAQSDLEAEKEAEKEQWKAVVEDREDQINRCKKELEDANILIDAMKKKGVLAPTEENIEALSPAAAAASRLLKSGMTLTQIYSEYVQASESLHLEKEENSRLNQYLDQILQEIEEKAPILKKQREDYENSLESISRLTSQLDTAMMESEKLNLRYDESQRVSKELMRENNRLQQTSTDLGRQVRMLLKELEEARGNVVSMSYGDDISSADVSSSSQVITENLVTFKNIEDLQEQNQRLLAVIRDLSEQKDKEESESSEARIKELKSQLDTSMADIEDMQSARQRQAEMVESIVRQRDMYKMMLNQASSSPLESPRFSTPMPQTTSTPHISSTPTSTHRSPVDDHSKKAIEDASVALKELQEEFSVYRREKKENESILNEQLEKFRTECSDMRVLNAKISSQLDFSAERYKVLQSNVDGYKKEITALREKAQKLSTNNAKYEETNATYRVELMTCQEKLSHAEAQCQNLRVEKDMLKYIEQRLLQEKEALLKDHKSQDLLMSNLQSIQNNLERSDFETKSRLGQKIEVLEKENAILRRKLDGVSEEHNKRGAALEKQLSEARSELDKERGVLHCNREQLRQAVDEISQLKKQLGAVETKLTTQTQAEVQHKTAPDTRLTEQLSKHSEQLKDLRNQLNTANNEVKGLKSQLADAMKKAEQYKAIAQSVEQNLEEQNKVSKELEMSVTRQLEEAKQVQDSLETQVKTLVESNEHLQKENGVLTTENKKLLDDTNLSSSGQQKRFEALQKDFSRVKEEREEAIKKQEAVRQDLEAQILLSKDAQDKYQRELMLHASDVSELTTIKEQLQGYTTKLDKAQEETIAACKILESKQSSWSEREAILHADHTKMENRVKEIQQQNLLLHEQLEQLSNQMVKLQQKTVLEEQEQRVLTQSVVEEGESRSSEQLLEVIRYLRKEKDISEAKLDGLQAENTRLQHQLEYHTKQLDEANKSLDETKYNEQVTMQTAVQHTELMKKVETLNLLQDSNRMLREEKDRANNQIKQLENKMKELEGEIVPLQETKKYLQGQYEALQVERNALQAEVQRWKGRTNALIEQCNKADPEEYKRMMQERDLVKKQLSTVNEETHKLRAELSKAKNQITQLQTELNASKQTVQKSNEELTALKTSVENKDKEIKDAGEKLTQLRKIGRKYRMQAEEVQHQLDEYVASNTHQQLEETHKSKIAEMDIKVKKVQDELATVTESLAMAESEKNSALKSIKEQENNAAKLTEQLKTLNEQLNREKTEAGKEKDALIKAREEVLEHKKKYNKSCQVLSGAKEKLSSQRLEIEKLTNDSKTLSEKLTSLEQKNAEYEAQTAAIRSQYEGRISQVQRDLDARQTPPPADNTELDKLKKENADITQKLQLVQRQLEAQQKQTAPTAPTRPTAAPTERPGTSTETVKTANIKPMTTPTTSSRPIQSAMIQPVRSTADSRIRASVQPMASTVTTSVTQSTPTATVMPVSVQDSDNTQQVAPLSQMSPQHLQQQQRPTQQVQPVSHVEEVLEEPEVMAEPEPVQSMSQAAQPVHAQPTVQPTQSTPSPVTTVSSTSQLATATVVSQAASTAVSQAASPAVSQAASTAVSQAANTAVSQSAAPAVSQATTPAVSQAASSAVISQAASSAVALQTACHTAVSQAASSAVISQAASSAVALQTACHTAVSQAASSAVISQAASSAVVLQTACHTAVSQAASSAVISQAASLTTVSQAATHASPAIVSQAAVVQAAGPAAVSQAASSAVISQAASPATVSQAVVVPPALATPQSVTTAVPASSTPHVVASTSSKRPRDDGESSDDQSIIIKRTKTQSPAVADVPVTPNVQTESQPVEFDVGTEAELTEQQTISLYPASQDLDTISLSIHPEDDTLDQIQEEDEFDDEGVVGEDYEGTEDDDNTRDSSMVEEAQGAIVLTSDDEEEEYEGQMDEYDDEEEEDFEDGEGMQEAYAEDDDEEMDDGMDEPMQDEDDDDDDVIVVDEDDVEPSPEEASMDPPAEEPQPTQPQSDRQSIPQAAPTTRQIPLLSRVPSQPDRLMPAGRAQQLPPFSFGEGAGFEVGDDGIVPSTPTLLVPRRHDDFAQAVSSPQIQRRFVFGASSEGVMQSTDLGRLETQGALGVDDIRMDLTQFDDASGSGRSVPVTPVSQNPPVISITEASPPRDSSDAPSQLQSEPGPPAVSPQESQQEPAAMSPQRESSQESTSQGETQEEGTSEKGQGEGTGGPGDEESQDASVQEEKPGTSDGGQDKAESSGSAAKPRIQRIVWDKPGTSDSPAQQMTSSPQGIVRHASPGAQGQRKLRGQHRGQRMQRPMQRGLLPARMPLQPLMGDPTIPRGQPRGRNMRGPKRGQFHQQHRQPPF